MRINKITIRRLTIDAQPFYGNNSIPRGEPHEWEFPLLILSTDEGIDGHTMAYGTNGEGRGTAYQLYDIFREDLIGLDPFESESFWHRMRRKHRHLYALSECLLGVMDVGLWDLKGKAMNKPIADLLGIVRRKVPSYASASWALQTPMEVAAEALAKKKAGFHAYKMQWREGPTKDIPKLCAAREAVGPDFRLMHDPNAQYTFHQALEVGRILDDLNFYWYEEPLPDRQTILLRKLADELKTPILSTETLLLGELAEVIRHTAGDMVRGDVHLKSGITGLRKMIATCELFGLNLEIHTAGTPLLDVANLHVACSTELSEFVETHHEIHRFGMKNTPLDIDDRGYVHLPTGAGLGVELDWDWIEKHTVEVLTFSE